VSETGLARARSGQGARETSIDSIEAALDRLRAWFRPEVAAAISLVCLVELSGKPGGRFWLRLDAGRLSSGEGGTPAPDLIVRASASDFYAFLDGSENPDLLYMEERIRIEGSLGLALSLRLAFAPPRDRGDDGRG